MGYPIRELSALAGAGFTGTANGATFDISDLDEVYVHVYGTFVGTIKVQVSYDGGTNWVDFQSLTAPGVSNLLPHTKKVRVICSAFTSGTILAAAGGRNKLPGIS